MFASHKRGSQHARDRVDLVLFHDPDARYSLSIRAVALFSSTTVSGHRASMRVFLDTGSPACSTRRTRASNALAPREIASPWVLSSRRRSGSGESYRIAEFLASTHPIHAIQLIQESRILRSQRLVSVITAGWPSSRLTTHWNQECWPRSTPATTVSPNCRRPAFHPHPPVRSSQEGVATIGRSSGPIAQRPERGTSGP
jgi:hypothetical protein